MLNDNVTVSTKVLSRDTPTSSNGRPKRPTSGGLIGWLRAAVVGLCWLYLVLVVVAALLVQFAVDLWWPGTLLGYGPRYLIAVPLVVVLPLALAVNRWACIPLALSALLIVWPIMGYCFPQLGTSQLEDGASRISVMTANVGGGGDLNRLSPLIRGEAADIVVLQEHPKSGDYAEIVGEGWHTLQKGGRVCASRYPIVDAETLQTDPTRKWMVHVVRFEIDGPFGTFHIFNIHLPTIRDGVEAVIADKFQGLPELERNTEFRRTESRLVSEWIESFPEPKILLGDFNMPERSAIYRRDWSQYENAFSLQGFGYGYTKFTSHHGVRIDHVLVDESWRVAGCHVGPSIGGDHRPVIAKLIYRE